MVERVEIFEKSAERYDRWYEENEEVYRSELKAVKKLLPKGGKSLEIGVGSGRFAAPLKLTVGLDPAEAMLNIAKKRGVQVVKGTATDLPFKNEAFRSVMMINTICFLDDPFKSIREAKRVIGSDGKILLGVLDKESFLGKIYESKKESSMFYSKARLHSVKKISGWLDEVGFSERETYQTIFKTPKDIKEVEKIERGHGKGGFAVISAEKSA